MNNTLTLPGYKYYVDLVSGERPGVFVTFLNLAEDRGSSANGVLIPVDGDALAALDARERNYDRLDISARITEPIDGVVWGYFGTPASVNRYAEAAQQAAAVVDRAYYDNVRAQFEQLGPVAFSDYLASTDEPACPLRDLTRLDL